MAKHTEKSVDFDKCPRGRPGELREHLKRRLEPSDRPLGGGLGLKNGFRAAKKFRDCKKVAKKMIQKTLKNQVKMKGV